MRGCGGGSDGRRGSGRSARLRAQQALPRSAIRDPSHGLSAVQKKRAPPAPPSAVLSNAFLSSKVQEWAGSVQAPWRFRSSAGAVRFRGPARTGRAQRAAGSTRVSSTSFAVAPAATPATPACTSPRLRLRSLLPALRASVHSRAAVRGRVVAGARADTPKQSARVEEGRVRGPRLGQFGAARYVLFRLISARLGSSRHQFGPTRAALAYTVRPLAPEDKLLSMAANAVARTVSGAS